MLRPGLILSNISYLVIKRVFHKINFVWGRWLVIVSNLIPIVQTETKQDVGLVSSNRTFKDTSTVL